MIRPTHPLVIASPRWKRMIDWLGARRPITLIVLGTTLLTGIVALADAVARS